MLTVFQGESRDGFMKYTTDRDCLSPQIIRFTERTFASLDEVIREAIRLELSGWHVCVDTLDYFYETEEN
jgi:hypothetical protein